MSGMLKGMMGMKTAEDTQQQAQQQQSGLLNADAGENQPRIGQLFSQPGASATPELGIGQLQQPTLMQNAIQQQTELQSQMAQLMKLMQMQ